jgi:lipase ATG15
MKERNDENDNSKNNNDNKNQKNQKREKLLSFDVINIDDENELNEIEEKHFEEEEEEVKCYRCTGNMMMGITYLGRIIITLYTFHGLFFIWNLIFQYIILFAGLLYNVEGILAQLTMAMIYVLFSLSVGNILVIPTYEFLTFPFLCYRNPFIHLMSFSYIIKNIKFETEKSLRRNIHIVNIFLIVFEFAYLLGFLCVWFSITNKLKDFCKCVILFLVYIYYLMILICYCYILIALIIKLLIAAYKEYNLNNKDKKENFFKKYWKILINSVLDLNVYFSKREELPDINLLSYVINPFLIKNYEFKDGKEVKKTYLEDYCDYIGIYQKILLLVLSIIVLIILNFKVTTNPGAVPFFSFLILFVVMSTLSIGINFPIGFRNVKSFGRYFASTDYRYKLKIRHPIMIPLIRIICNSLSILICFGLCVIFFFKEDDESTVTDLNQLDLNPKYISKISSLTKGQLLPSMCFSSIYHLPIHYYIPFIVDAYYYTQKSNSSEINEEQISSSLEIENYKHLFFGDDYKITSYGNLIENQGDRNVKMIQYNIRGNKDEVTVLSIKGTSYKKDIFLDIQLYFSSVLLSILSTFSLSQRENNSNRLIEYSLSIPYRIFFHFLFVNNYINLLIQAYFKNRHRFYDNIIIVGHSLGGGLAKILGRFIRKQAISLSGPGINAFNSLWKYEGNSEYFSISAIDLVPDMDLVPRVEVSGGTVYRIACIAGVFGCHSKERSLCETLIMCRHPNYYEYCSKVALLDENEINTLLNNTKLNNYENE